MEKKIPETSKNRKLLESLPSPPPLYRSQQVSKAYSVPLRAGWGKDGHLTPTELVHWLTLTNYIASLFPLGSSNLLSTGSLSLSAADHGGSLGIKMTKKRPRLACEEKRPCQLQFLTMQEDCKNQRNIMERTITHPQEFFPLAHLPPGISIGQEQRYQHVNELFWFFLMKLIVLDQLFLSPLTPDLLHVLAWPYRSPIIISPKESKYLGLGSGTSNMVRSLWMVWQYMGARERVTLEKRDIQQPSSGLRGQKGPVLIYLNLVQQVIP